MFEADRPILKSDQDRLGRAVFAKYLARCILEHNNPESLVIGLYGGWGVGKTSVINLMLEELQFASNHMLDDEKPIILNFSPWSYSGQNQLIYNFFRRLSSVIRQSPYLQNAERIIHLLELYVSFFTNKTVPRSLRQKKLFGSYDYGWESGHDLTAIKVELNELLMKLKRKIIIVIDNISHIEDGEIKQIFQIVKSMGDYTNTVYLLSMDKKMVINAIDRIYGTGGKNLLEKIVQLPFDVPAISKQDLEKILLDKLESIIAIAPLNSWDSKHWADIYYSSLKHFFRNCRDITRYVNTLSFGFGHVKEVTNPVDFFAITALEIFEPHVYEGVRDNKDLFTDLVNQMTLPDAEKLAKDKLRCDEILDRAKHIPRAALIQLLIYLFPRLRAVYQPNVLFFHSESLVRKNRRICSSDLFDVYFRLSMSSGHIPRAEFEAILALANNADSFDLALARLNQDDRIEKFLDLLDGADQDLLPIQYVPNIINALVDNADLFPEGENSQLHFNTAMRLHRIFQQLLRRYDSSEERFRIFSNAIKNSVKSYYIIVHELILQSQQYTEDETEDTYIPLEYRDFTPLQIEEFKNIAVEKIKYWAELGRLGEHPKLIPILYAWKNWGNEIACREFVESMVKTDRGIIALLTQALKEPIDQAISKLAPNPEWKKYLANIEAFIPLNAVEPHAKLLFEDPYFEKLREREQLALLIFLDLIQAKTKKVIPKTTT